MYRVVGSPRWGSAAVFIAPKTQGVALGWRSTGHVGPVEREYVERYRLTAAATPRASTRIATPSRWSAAVVCAATKPQGDALGWRGPVGPAEQEHA
ncbi:hypothetical protein CA51_38560 [Rosistilla oblonga]|nr:hypothetical protein CA51_38560 [Rosistilla oblonga]